MKLYFGPLRSVIAESVDGLYDCIWFVPAAVVLHVGGNAVKDETPQTPVDISPTAPGVADLVYSASTEETGPPPVFRGAAHNDQPSAATPDYPIADFYEPVQWKWTDTTFEVLQALREWSKHTDADY